MQKKETGKGKNVKREKKIKEVRGDQHIKGCESQIFKSKSRSIVKRSWSETLRDYRRQ